MECGEDDARPSEVEASDGLGKVGVHSSVHTVCLLLRADRRLDMEVALKLSRTSHGRLKLEGKAQEGKAGLRRYYGGTSG